MVEVKVYDSIANKDEGTFIEAFGIENQVFSADAVRSVFENNSHEKDFRFNIHCNGGSVSEGLAIYDLIRTSGKNIYAHIDGACHSMAVVVLLAAPLKNRTANVNASALLHRVRYNGGEGMTAAELSAAAKLCVDEESKILRIYAERTGRGESEMRKLMNAEKEHPAQKLLELGFISRITSYNTNMKVNPKNQPKNSKAMAKPVNKTTAVAKPAVSVAAPKGGGNFKQKVADLFNKITSALSDESETLNYDYADAEGNVLFSTEAEEDTLAVGDAVTIPDGSTEGTFELPDGRTVTVADGAVTEITEPAEPTEDAQRVAALEAEVVNLKALLNEAKTVIEGFKEHGGSNYVPNGRTVAVAAKKTATPSKDDLKNAMREKRKLVYGGGGGGKTTA
ncbi:MAG: ATP-dependent Clp protease proteolytic subunit [Prevotellaceae bacterium]|jgi:ATP-dependent Clp protease protease subunit|nr:ATP-dependent Clp protease proteolytic subunit [Prevotellaceae bacterium]